MTTIRERVERGERNKEMIAYFWENKGATPLCCFEIDAKGRVSCSYIKRYIPRNKFNIICSGCQTKIAEILGENKCEKSK